MTYNFQIIVLYKKNWNDNDGDDGEKGKYNTNINCGDVDSF